MCVNCIVKFCKLQIEYYEYLDESTFDEREETMTVFL
jgi:hypothetical protein